MVFLSIEIERHELQKAEEQSTQVVMDSAEEWG
jgi:hypothetical protein